MDELLQMLKDANEARRQGATQAQIDAYIAQATNGKYLSHRDLSGAVRVQTVNPSAMARRRQSAMAQELAPDMEASTGPLEAAASGATFGLTPIIGGALEALTGGNFREGREAAKARLDAFANAHPVQSALSSLGGGVASIPLTGPAALKAAAPLARLFRVAPAVEGAAPSMWNLARQGAAVGIPAGAVYGATQAPSLSDVPQQFALGGIEGGILGGGIGAASRIAVPAAEALLTRTRAFFNPTGEANRQVTQGLARVINPNVAEAQLSEAEHLRPGLARLGDANPTAYGAAMRRTPDAVGVGEQLRVRTEGAGERLAQSAEAAAGFQPGRAPNAINASGDAERAFNAYSRAVYRPIEEAHSAMNITEYPKIAAVLQDERVAPVVQRVLRRPIVTDPTVNIQGRQMRVSELPPAMRASLEQAGALPKPSTVPFTALQEVENELGRMADRLPAGANFTESQLRAAAQELRGAMREEIPGLQRADAGWSAALDVYGPREKAGNSGLLGAFAQGAKARTLPPEQMAQELGKLNEEARSAYRMGLLSDIVGDLRGARAGVNASRIGTTQGTQTLEPHLREAFGSTQAMNRFLRTAEVEDFFRRSQELYSGGSQTAQRGEVARQMFPNENGQRGLFGRLADQFRSDAITIPPEQLASGYSQRLNTQGPEMFKVLEMIRQAQSQAANEGPMMQRLVQQVAPAASGPGRDATAAAELAALLALINGGKAVGRMVTGSTSDRGN